MLKVLKHLLHKRNCNNNNNNDSPKKEPNPKDQIPEELKQYSEKMKNLAENKYITNKKSSYSSVCFGIKNVLNGYLHSNQPNNRKTIIQFYWEAFYICENLADMPSLDRFDNNDNIFAYDADCSCYNEFKIPSKKLVHRLHSTLSDLQVRLEKANDALATKLIITSQSGDDCNMDMKYKPVTVDTESFSDVDDSVEDSINYMKLKAIKYNCNAVINIKIHYNKDNDDFSSSGNVIGDLVKIENKPTISEAYGKNWEDSYDVFKKLSQKA